MRLFQCVSVTNQNWVNLFYQVTLLKTPIATLKAHKIFQDNKTKTNHYDHARIHLFNIPVFYLPYFSHPDPSVNKRSGFLMPTVETDQNLGDTFSIPIFYNIESNRDLTFTPTIQSNSNDFYSLNYRHMNNLGNLNVDSCVSLGIQKH